MEEIKQPGREGPQQDKPGDKPEVERKGNPERQGGKGAPGNALENPEVVREHGNVDEVRGGQKAPQGGQNPQRRQ